MTIHIFGGGTISDVRSHMALCAKARGRTARRLGQLLIEDDVAVRMHLTFMADPDSELETNEDVERRLREVLALPSTRAIIANVALVDFAGQIGDVPSGKYAARLQTREVTEAGVTMTLQPKPKLLALVKQLRPDVLLVGFKTTADEAPHVQVVKANRMAKECGVDFILANDVVTRNNLVVRGGGAATLDNAAYAGQDREHALQVLVDVLMAEVRHV